MVELNITPRMQRQNQVSRKQDKNGWQVKFSQDAITCAMQTNVQQGQLRLQCKRAHNCIDLLANKTRYCHYCICMQKELQWRNLTSRFASFARMKFKVLKSRKKIHDRRMPQVYKPRQQDPQLCMQRCFTYPMIDPLQVWDKWGAQWWFL